jgi:CopG family nickel-responsive transcriptional regulator
MEQMERVGISVASGLLKQFDKMISSQGYQNRSEAIRDLIRTSLSKQQLENPNQKAVAAVCVVYNHHSSQLMQKLTHLQHNHLLETVCSMHIHLDADDCMEVIILRGKVSDIIRVGENMTSQKGVKLGKVNLIAAQ